MNREMLLAMVLSASSLWAQSDQSTATKTGSNDRGQVTVRGCVSRAGGDYILMKENPAVTYELQGNSKIRLGAYLGKRVEVTGREAPSMSTSEDALNRTGNASPVTITVTSIHTVSEECQNR